MVLPVIYDDETGEIDNENFNEILAVVRGLASNDERIVEFFSDINQTTTSGDKGFLDNWEVVPERLDSITLQRSLEIRVIDSFQAYDWNITFSQYKSFLERQSAHPTTISSKQLATWASSQRHFFKTSVLEDWKIHRLNSIDFVWNKVAYKWQISFDACMSWIQSNEGMFFFQAAPPEMIKWYNYQRRKLNTDQLKQDEKTAFMPLFEIVGTAVEEKFRINLAQLLEFISHDEEKTWPIYDRANPNSTESKLGVFCQSLKQKYRKGNLEEPVLTELENLGFPFSHEDNLQETWTSMAQKCQELAEKQEGVSMKSMGKKHYRWLKMQYDLMLDEELKPWQHKIIVSMNLEKKWDKNYKWHETLEAVKSWIVAKKRLPGYRSHPEFFSWLKAQGNRDDLSLSQQAALKEIEEWQPKSPDDIWKDRFEELIRHLSDNKGKYPSFSSKTDVERKIYNWVQAQRQAKTGKSSGGRRKRLEQWRIEKLESIGFQWVTDIGDSRNDLHVGKMLDKLHEFLQLNSIDKIKSTTQPKLWRYLKKIIELRDSNKLTAPQSNRLLEMGLTSEFTTSGRDGYGKWVSANRSLIEFIRQNKRIPHRTADTKEYMAFRRLMRLIEGDSLSQKQIAFLEGENFQELLDSL